MLLKATQEAVNELGADARVIDVTDIAAIAATGVLRTPGLLINDVIKVMGRVPSVKEIKQLIADAM